MRRNVVTAAFTVSILSLLAPDARALEHAWSRQYTGTGTQHVAAVAADFNGNIYVAGHFYNTSNFGGADRTSAGGSDIMLVKLDAAGAYQWDTASATRPNSAPRPSPPSRSPATSTSAGPIPGP